MFYVEFQNIAHHTLNLLNSWVAKFYDLSAIETDNMIMLLVAIRFFELSHVFAKLMLGNQIA